MSVVYRFAITTLDGTTPLPAGFRVTTPAGADGVFVVSPPGGGPFAALGLIDPNLLAQTRSGRDPLLDDYLAARISGWDANGAPGTVTATIESLGLVAGTPTQLESLGVIGAAGPDFSLVPRSPLYTGEVLGLAGASAGPFVVELALLKLPPDAAAVVPEP